GAHPGPAGRRPRAGAHRDRRRRQQLHRARPGDHNLQPRDHPDSVRSWHRARPLRDQLALARRDHGVALDPRAPPASRGPGRRALGGEALSSPRRPRDRVSPRLGVAPAPVGPADEGRAVAAHHRYGRAPARGAHPAADPQRPRPPGQVAALMAARTLRLLALAAVVCGIFACVPAAQAGTWIQVSCVNPDGSAAPSEGWSAASTGTPEAGSSESARCPMYGELSPIGGAAKVGDSEYVQYTPPEGSKLVGGVANMTMSADSGGTASGDAVLYEPALAYPSSVFFQCAWSLAACGPPSSPNDTTGSIYLPNDAGGDFIAQATCGGNPGTTCSEHETGATASSPWSSVQVNWAQFTLSNSAVPAASGFSGTALQPGVRGTGSLLFTATDTGGPGVYSVTASIDGTPVYSGTPNANGGACVPVGSNAGALMFDYQQPCPAAEAVSIPI